MVYMSNALGQLNRGDDSFVLFSYQILFERVLIEAGRFELLLREDSENNKLEKPDLLNTTLTFDSNEGSSNISIVQPISEMIIQRSEALVFSIDRLIKWSESLKKRGIIRKKSKIGDFIKKWKPEVLELRNQLLHMDEYIVRGGGRKPENFMQSQLGLITAGPNSVLRLEDCRINGVEVKNAYFIGIRLEFFSCYSDLQELYKELRVSNFFKTIAHQHFETSN